MGFLGWLLDLFRLGGYVREANGDVVHERPGGLVGATVSGFTLAWMLGLLLESTWSYGYDSSHAEGMLLAETDVRSWADGMGKIAALALHTMVATAGAWLGGTMAPHHAVSTSATFVLAGLAVGYAAAPAGTLGETASGGLHPLAGYSLPAIAALGAVVGVLLTTRVRAPEQLQQRRRKGGACSTFLAILGWWVFLAVVLVAHADVTPDTLAVKLPRECRGSVAAGLGVGTPETAWVLPAWHEQEYLRHLATRCRAHKDTDGTGSTGGESAPVKHSVKLGPLLYANTGKVGKLIADLWNEVSIAIRASGGWSAFAQELFAKARDQTATDYATLGLSEGATLAEVKGAFRGLARKLHPDRLRDATPEQREESTARFRKVSEAYERLSNKLSKEGGAEGGGRAGETAEPTPEPRQPAADAGAGKRRRRGASREL